MSEYSDALQVVIDEQRAELSAWRRLAEGLDGFFRVAEDARVFRVASGRWWLQVRAKHEWTWLGEDHPSAPAALAAYAVWRGRQEGGE
jgi:hypothetical protein